MKNSCANKSKIVDGLSIKVLAQTVFEFAFKVVGLCNRWIESERAFVLFCKFPSSHLLLLYIKCNGASFTRPNLMKR